jgi:hypothetical protein
MQVILATFIHQAPVGISFACAHRVFAVSNRSSALQNDTTGVPSMMFDLSELMPRMSQPVEPFQIDQWELCELLYVEAVGNHMETWLLCILMHTLV